MSGLNPKAGEFVPTFGAPAGPAAAAMPVGSPVGGGYVPAGAWTPQYGYVGSPHGSDGGPGGIMFGMGGPGMGTGGGDVGDFPFMMDEDGAMPMEAPRRKRKPRQRRSVGGGAPLGMPAPARLKVSGLSDDVDAMKVVGAFEERFGRVTGCDFGHSIRGENFGFIVFESPESADTATRFSGTKILGMTLRIERATGPAPLADGGDSSPSASSGGDRPDLPPQPASHTLVLKNLNRDMNTEQLTEFLNSQVVQPVWVDRRAASGGKAAAVAFVRYKDPASAVQARSLIEGYDLTGRRIKVEFKRQKDRTRSRGGSEDWGAQAAAGSAPVAVAASAPGGSEPIHIQRRRSRGMSMGGAPVGSYSSSIGSEEGGGSFMSSSWRERRAMAQAAAAASSAGSGGGLPDGSPNVLPNSLGSTSNFLFAKGPEPGKGFAMKRSVIAGSISSAGAASPGPGGAVAAKPGSDASSSGAAESGAGSGAGATSGSTESSKPASGAAASTGSGGGAKATNGGADSDDEGAGVAVAPAPTPVAAGAT